MAGNRILIRVIGGAGGVVVSLVWELYIQLRVMVSHGEDKS